MPWAAVARQRSRSGNAIWRWLRRRLVGPQALCPLPGVCTRAVARFLGRRVKHMLFSLAQFLILQNLDFVNLSAILLSLFLQFPSVNFFKIWQHGKIRFRFDDERFKFTNQNLQYFLTMKTIYFNITEKLAPWPPFFSLLMKLWQSNLPVHTSPRKFEENLNNDKK